MPRVTVPLLDESYESQSKVQSVRELVNFYLEEDTTQQRWIAVGTPGFELWLDLSGSVIRGMFEHSGSGYVVADDEVYKIDDQFTSTNIGTLSTTTGRVSIAATNDEIAFADGAKTWIYSISGATFTEVTDSDYDDTTTQITATNDYFIAIKPGSDQFFVSDLVDGTSWSATSFASADVSYDNLVTGVVANTFLWLLGEKTTEIWYNSGGDTIPFDRAVAGAISYGCAAADSALVINNTVHWLAQNAHGIVGVVASDGESTTLLSHRAMVTEMEGYNSTSDAFAWTYQENGHIFYIITFPNTKTIDAVNHGTSWAYDLTTGKWAEWKSIYSGATVDPGYSRHRANAIMNLAGDAIIGDYESGKLYKLSPDVHLEDTDHIQRSITTQHLLMQGQVLSVNNLKVETENGSGLVGSGQGSDPQIMLRHSKNRGRTWSDTIYRSSGKVGEYENQATWNRIGSGRSVTFELTMTDPIKWIVLGANALMDVEA